MQGSMFARVPRALHNLPFMERTERKIGMENGNRDAVALLEALG